MAKTSWSNRLSFILTTAAFSVGLGNIWRFPYITGEGGGGAFLLIYLVLIFLIGIPIMTIEIGLGRMSKATTLLGYGKLGKHRSWNLIGWLEVLTVMFIMNFYVMILAWVFIYFLESLTGNFSQIETTTLADHFSAIASDLKRVFVVILGIMILASYIVRKGLQAGLERYSKWMMYSLFILLIGLSIWAATLEGAWEGYRWYLAPDFSKISVGVILSAIGQLFFSLGVGMAAAFSFGSYTSDKDNLISSTAWIVFADSFVAVLAGFIIFPAIFTYGLAPDSGPNLIFITMTSVFGSLDQGQWLGAVFFLLLFLAGFTSLISCMQGMKDSLRDKYQLKEWQALLAISGFITLGAIPVVYSYSSHPFTISGMAFYQVLDFLTGAIMLPLGGLAIVVFGAHIVGFAKLKSHLQLGAGTTKISNYWKPILQWVIPIVLLIILINGLLG